VRAPLHADPLPPVAGRRIRTHAGCAIGVCAGVCAGPPSPGGRDNRVRR
jgi:hypothetical protein